jgi:hypothetical protein
MSYLLRCLRGNTSKLQRPPGLKYDNALLCVHPLCGGGTSQTVNHQVLPFQVAGTHIRNGLPAEVTSALSQPDRVPVLTVLFPKSLPI